MRPLAAVLSGLLFASAFPLFNLTLLAWVAMVPVLLALRDVSLIKAAGLCALFTLSAVLTLVSWVPGVLLDGFGSTWLGAGGVWLALALSSVPAALLYGALVSRLRANTILYPLTVGLLWACVELSWANAFPKLPWVVLGASQIDTPIAPLAALVGVHGVSGLVAATSAAFVQLLVADSRRYAAISSALLVVTTVGGTSVAGRYLEARPVDDQSLRVAIVQPGLPMSRRREIGFERENIRVLIEESEAALSEGEVDLLVWPESSFLSTPHSRSRLTNQVQALADDHDVRILAGGRRRDGNAWRTSVFAFDPGSDFEVIYDKRVLFPLAERVPAWITLTARRALGQTVPSISHQAGSSPGEVRIKGHALSVYVCFEATFQWNELKGSALLVNVVNDGWYDRTAGGEQHFLLSRWRSIERAAVSVRSGTTGISAFVDSRGRAVSALLVGEQAHLSADLSRAGGTTPFERLGNAPLLLVAAATSAVLVVGSASTKPHHLITRTPWEARNVA